jgi:enoyl-CoA hydratase
MMADFIIASENAGSASPRSSWASRPAWAASQRLTRAVGKAKAMEMCLTGRMMDAEEAERSGLVARVVPLAAARRSAEDRYRDRRDAAARRDANKEMVNAAFETTLDQGLLIERRMFQVLTATEDKAEGMAAFVEKRRGVDGEVTSPPPACGRG